MNAMTKPTILPDDESHVEFRDDIEGWVCRHGHFHGNSKVDAMLCSATVTYCDVEGCGNIIEKGRVYCDSCAQRRIKQRWENMPVVEYSGEPLYRLDHDEFFENVDELKDWVSDNTEYEFDDSRLVEKMMLQVCDTVGIRTLDDAYFLDDFPELDNLELHQDVKNAIDELNRLVRKHHSMVCYEPANKRPSSLNVSVV